LLSVANQSNITGLGTITSGTWQSSTAVIASAYLDADTAHLSGSQTFTGAKTFQAGGTFQENVFFENTDSNKPYLQFTNTNSGTTSSQLWFIKDKGAAGANGDDIATFLFRADNSAQEITSFAQILAEVGTALDTDEAGKLTLGVTASNGSTTGMKDAIVLTGHGTNNIVDASIGYGTTSTTTIAGGLNVTESIRGKIIHIEKGALSDDIDTTEHFFPATTTSESTSFTNVATPFLMPVAGKLLKIHLKAHQNHNTSSNEVTFKLYDLDDGENWNDANKNLLGTKVIDGTVKATVMVADFQDLTTTGASGTNAFQAGDFIGISITNSQDLGVTSKYIWSFVFELDFSSY